MKEDVQPAAVLAELMTERLAGQEELRLHLKASFQERIGQAGAGPEEIAAGCARVREVRAKRKRSIVWVWSGWAALIVLWLAVLGVWIQRIMAGSDHSGSLPRIMREEAERREKAHMRKLGGAAFLNWGSDQEISRWIDEWRSRSPDDPAAYRLWIYQNYFDSSEELPADYDATWKRIDPDNGSWLLTKAAKYSRKAMGGANSRRAIVDRDAYQQMVEAVEAAQELPRREGYRETYVRMILESFPHPQSYEEALAGQESADLIVMWTGWPGAPFMVEFERLRKAGDHEGMANLAAQIRRSLMREYLLGYDRSVSDFSRAFRKAQLHEEAEKIEALGRTIGDPPEKRPLSPDAPISIAKRYRDLWFVWAWVPGGALAVAGMVSLAFLPPSGVRNQGAGCAGSLLGRWSAAWVMLIGIVAPLAGMALTFALLPQNSPLRSFYDRGAWFVAGWTLAGALLLQGVIVRELRKSVSVVGLAPPRWERSLGNILCGLTLLCLLLLCVLSVWDPRIVGAPEMVWLAVIPALSTIFLIAWMIRGSIRCVRPGMNGIQTRLTARLVQSSMAALAFGGVVFTLLLISAERQALAGDPTSYYSTPHDPVKPLVKGLPIPAEKKAELERIQAEWEAQETP